MCQLLNIVERLKLNQPQSLPWEFPRASVLLPITDNDVDPELVFTRRATHLSKHGGQVAFPGGKWDLNDGSLYETALRESREEIGLDPSLVQRVGRLNEVVSKHQILVSPYVGIIPSDVELIANPDEIESIFKIPVSYFLQASPDRVDKLGFRGRHVKVPCYMYEGYEIWGMSAMVLVDFLNVALDAKLKF